MKFSTKKEHPSLIGFRRPFSGGELFALLTLVVSFSLSLLVGLGFAFMQGRELMPKPSWLIVHFLYFKSILCM